MDRSYFPIAPERWQERIMGDAQVYQQNFDKIFSQYQKKRIAVYGTGQNARLIAEHVSGYEIVGFISRDGTAGMLSGERILLIEEAVNIADLILIAATASSTNIVYSRIKDIVPPEMKVLDLYGEILNKKESYKDNPYWKKDYKALCLEIDRYPVISFDVFDTLVMRMTLMPEDIFEMVGNQYCVEGQKGDFRKWRKDAELENTLRKRTPSFADIYETLKEEHIPDEEQIETLKQWEFSQEKRCILPRDRMVEVFRYALSCGKRIFFTSDMYFSSQEIRQLLRQCKMEDGFELLVSCELHASKQDGHLYGKLKELAGTDQILHIGDNDRIDGVMAEKSGIHSFTILSAYDMLTSSSIVNLFDCVKTKDDKNYLGYFASVMLNDPFALSEYAGKLHLSFYRDLALVIYPMTMMYLNYIVKNAGRYDCILFPSRDGFFLYQLYNRLKDTKMVPGLPDARYVYGSRMALSRAAVKDRETFTVLLDKLFSNQTVNCKEYVRNQFDIEIPEEYDAPGSELIKRWGREGVIERLGHYLEQITKTSEKHKIRYARYLDSLGLDRYRSFAMVDVVSYGTQVYCLSQLLGKRIDMIAVGTTDIPNKYVENMERVFSIYGNVNKRADGAIYSCSSLSVMHLFLELLYASADGQFVGFLEDQTPVFQEQTNYHPKLVTGVQQELLKIMDKMADAGFHYQEISPEFAMGMLELMFSKYSDMDEKLKEQFVFSDPYMGGFKTLNLTDLL